MKKLLLISLLLCSFAGVAKAQIVTSTSLNINRSSAENKAIVKLDKLPAENTLTAEISIYDYDRGQGRKAVNSITPKYSRYFHVGHNGWVSGYGASLFIGEYTCYPRVHAFTGWRTTKDPNNYVEFTIAPEIGYCENRIINEFFLGGTIQLIGVSNKFVYGLSFEINDDDINRTYDKGLRLVLGYKF